jgi:hypothetical protein
MLDCTCTRAQTVRNFTGGKTGETEIDEKTDNYGKQTKGARGKNPINTHIGHTGAAGQRSLWCRRSGHQRGRCDHDGVIAAELQA